MSTIINATTTNGVVIQPDNSGSLALQSNGTTMASATPTGFNIGGVVASGYIMKNRIINGDMVIDQRNAGASVTPADVQYTLDRWKSAVSAASKFTIQQVSTAPTGFNNSLKITSLSAYSITSTSYFGTAQSIEGYNVADLGFGTANAKTITISFWVRSSLTGTFGGCIRNENADRGYPFTYTILVADTWEQKTVTIAGDTTGTWNTTNGVGLQVCFSIGTGSSYSATAGAWTSTASLFSATGATSLVGTNGATLYITGVQLEVGSTATSFDYRPYTTELQLCQRYYYCIGGAFNGSVAYQYYSMGFLASATVFIGTITYPVTMRTSPSFVPINPTNFRVYASGGTQLCTAVNLDVSSNTIYGFSATIPAGLVAYQGARIIQDFNNATQMQFSAEL